MPSKSTMIETLKVLRTRIPGHGLLPFIISLVSICPVTTSLGMYLMSLCTAETNEHQSINRKDTATHFMLIYTTLEILCVKSSWKYVWLPVPVYLIDSLISS